MQISANGLAIIKQFEQFRPTAYLPTPRDVWTIGWGHTAGVEQGDTCTQNQAQEWLLEDTYSAAHNVAAMAAVPLAQNQFDALVSLVFNIGAHNFDGSTLLRKLNAGDYAGAADQFTVWNKQAGRVLPGLVMRRAEERALFLKA